MYRYVFTRQKMLNYIFPSTTVETKLFTGTGVGFPPIRALSSSIYEADQNGCITKIECPSTSKADKVFSLSSTE